MAAVKPAGPPPRMINFSFSSESILVNFEKNQEMIVIKVTKIKKP